MAEIEALWPISTPCIYIYIYVIRLRVFWFESGKPVNSKNLCK